MASGKPIGSFYVGLGLDTREFRKSLQGVQRDLRSALGSTAVQTSERLAASVAGIAVALGAVGAASVAMAADLERSRVSFTRLLGSADAADKKLRELQDFAAKTPFTFTELIEYEKRLLALGFSANETKQYLTTFGDAASALGLGAEGLGRIIKAFGDIKTKGKVATQELNQLGEAGVNARQILADGLGKTVAQVMDMVEDRALDSATAITILTAGLNQKFGGMMSLQSETMIGMWSTVRDEVENIMRDLGAKIVKALKLNEALKTVRDGLTQLREDIEKSGLFNTLWNMLGEPMRVAVVALTGAITGALIPAMINLGAVLLLAFSPLIMPTLIMAGIALIGYAIYNFGDILQGIGGLIDAVAVGAYNAIKGVANFLWETAKAAWLMFGQLADEAVNIFKVAFKSIKALTWDLAKEVGLMVRNPFTYKQSDTGPLKTALNDAKAEYHKAFDNFQWPTMPDNDPGEAGLGWFKEIKKSLPALEEAKNKIKDLSDSVAAFGSRVNKNSTPDLSALVSSAGGGKTKAAKEKTGGRSLIDIAKENAREGAAMLAEQESARQEYLQRQKQAELEHLAEIDDAYYESAQRKLSGEQLEATLRADMEAGSLEAYVAHLNEKEAADRAYLEGRSELMSTYDMLQADAHRSNMSYMAEGYRTVYSGLTEALTGIITGAKNAGEAFKDLGMQIIQMVIKWQIQKRLAAMMSQTIEATTVATSVASAAAVSAAWAPAAAMVAAATFGASTAAAGAGLTGLTALSRGLSIPGLAEGGIVSQPTLAMIGEGGEREAVIPLSKLENMTGGAGGGVVVNVINQSGVPMTARSSQRVDGRKMVMDLWLSALNDNVSGSQDILGRR